MEHAVFNVGLKLFVTKGDKVLLLFDPRVNRWDIPGGRMDEGEEKLPFLQILGRELTEELGPGFKYELSSQEPQFVFRTFPGLPSKAKKTLLLGFVGKHLSGEPKLSEEHSLFKWVEIESADPEKLFHGGFADGFRQFQLNWKLKKS